jgi:hypothetical protein
MKKMNKETNMATDKFWVVFTHPDEKDKEENYLP